MRKMRIGIVSLCFIFWLSENVYSQTIFSIGNDEISAGEFEYVYKKNSFNNPDAFTKKDIKDYFQLYIDFKLKVHEAQQLGYDTIPSLLNEYKGYQNQIRKPYLTDTSLTQQLVREAYDRLFEEVRAAHILILVDQDASDQDTLEAWNKISELKKRAEAGESFENLARQYSEDPSAAQNGGDLGYFTSMQMVYPFEDAAFKLKPGDISAPIRTQYGYHVIKSYDKRKSEGQVQVAHIMLRFARFMSPEDSSKLENKAKEIYNKLHGGLDWDEACGIYSEDQASKSSGGLLRPFRRSNLPPAFADVAFSLSGEGDVSKPFQTSYGWHIVKLVKKIGVEPFDELSDMIEGRVSNDARAGIQKSALISKLKTENGFTLYAENVDKLLNDEQPENKYAIAEIGDSTFYSTSVPETVRTSNKSGLIEWLDEQVIVYEESILAQKYPEYKYLSNEYWEGILLFQVMNDKVWNPAVTDTAGLYKFYQDNIKQYQWKERMTGFVLESSEKVVIDSVSLFIGENNETNIDSIRLYLDENSMNLYQIKEGPFEKGHETFNKSVKFEVGFYTDEADNAFKLVVLNDYRPAGPKDFEKIKGVVISDYQEWLEKQFVESLRDKYTVKINKKVKKNVFKELSK